MKPTLRLGSIAGIPIGVHWSVIGIMVVVADILAVVVLPDVAAGHSTLAYWVTGVMAAISLLASIAVHEVAHAVVAKRNGVAVDRITLWLLGGVSALREEPSTPQAELRVAIAGPIASMVVALTAGAATVIAGALSAPDLAVAATFWLAVTNGILALFNLLPGAPLDGGRVLRAVLWRRYDDRTRAGLIAARTGHSLGVGLMAVGAVQVLLTGTLSGLWLALIGWFVMSSATADARQTELRRAFGDLRVHEVMSREPECVRGWETVEQFVTRSADDVRHSAFPVLDLDGAPAGVVTLDQMSRVPLDLRESTRLGDIAVPASRITIVGPDERLIEVVAHPPGIPVDGLALVVEDERLVGVISSGDLNRTIQRSRLHPL